MIAFDNPNVLGLRPTLIIALEPFSFRSLITVMVSPDCRILPFASLVTLVSSSLADDTLGVHSCAQDGHTNMVPSSCVNSESHSGKLESSLIWFSISVSHSDFVFTLQIRPTRLARQSSLLPWVWLGLATSAQSLWRHMLPGQETGTELQPVELLGGRSRRRHSIWQSAGARCSNSCRSAA